MMRFIGKPEGKLMKGAPGYPYKHDEVYLVDWSYRQDAFWVPLEPVPELKVPPPTEEELNIGAFVAPPENVVLAEPEESDDEKFVRQETESMGDAILGVDGVIPKRRKSKVAQP